MCDSPLFVSRSSDGKEVPVPCGRCPHCQERRVNDWVFRLLQEDRVSTSAHFITLTYDAAHVPMSPHGFMTLRKKDFQDYMKRLRKLSDAYCHKHDVGFYLSIKYYACGEYGDINKRPHFHAIVFNVPDPQLFVDAWSLDGIQLGIVDVGTVTGDSIAYCCKYINKQHRHTRKFHRDDRVGEFSLMSNGLGKSYLTDKTIRYHRADLSRNYISKEGGYKIALPRFYRDRIFTLDEKLFQSSLAQDASYEQELKDRRYVQETYGDSMSYESWVQAGKAGRLYSFTKNIKLRNGN